MRDANDILRIEGPDRLREIADAAIVAAEARSRANGAHGHPPEPDPPWPDDSADPHQSLDAEPPEPARIHASPYLWTDPAEIPLRQFVYGRHLSRGNVSATVAPGGMAKTSLIIAEALAMASGRDLLGETLPHRDPLRIWVWNLEDDRNELSRRVQASALHHGLTPDDLGDRLFLDSGRDQPCVIATMGRNGGMICRPVVESLVAELIARRIDVLQLDPFISTHELPENDNGAMDLVVKEWARVASRANCAIHLVHHVRKSSGEAEITAEATRGGKAFVDACRSVRVLNRMSKEEGQRAGIDNHRLYFRAYVDKGNFAPPSEVSTWFRLVGVPLGNGPFGGDNVGVVERWNWPDAFDGVTVRDLLRVQQAVAAGTWKQSVQAKTWVGNAVADALGWDAADPNDKARIKGLLKGWLTSGALIVVTKLDEFRHDAPFVEVGQWADAK